MDRRLAVLGRVWPALVGQPAEWWERPQTDQQLPGLAMLEQEQEPALPASRVLPRTDQQPELEQAQPVWRPGAA
jgi:hypothetical protein